MAFLFYLPLPDGYIVLYEAIRAGVSFDRLNKAILTHQDIDHVGSLPAILANSQHKIEVYAHELEKPYIEGDKPLIKMDPARRAKMSKPYRKNNESE